MSHKYYTCSYTKYVYDVGDLFERVFFVCLLISLLKRLHIVLIKTFTMHVEDVNMEIACKLKETSGYKYKPLKY